MSNLKQLRQRIKSAKNTCQITRAMKLVSAAKFRKAQDKVVSMRKYKQEFYKLVPQAKKYLSYNNHFLTFQKEKKSCLIILITSDRGLAGSFNNAILKEVQNFIVRMKNLNFEFVCIGKKGFQFCQRRNYKIIRQIVISQTQLDFNEAINIGKFIQDLHLKEKIDHSVVCYSKFYSALKQEPLINQIFPVEFSTQEEKEGFLNDSQVEPNIKAIADEIIQTYFYLMIYEALVDSIASEHGARMSAMTNATENAGKMIHKLTALNNRERQTRITKEILEIVGGAEALKK